MEVLIVDYTGIWPAIILAVAVSIDGFTVGVTYGLRNIRIGFLSLMIIGAISSILIYLTASLGVLFAAHLSLELARILGSLIIIGIGIWLIYSNFQEMNSQIKEERDLILSLQIKPFGIIINILRDPGLADFDKSGNINYLEAVFLGLALALDTIGAGLGVGLTGFTYLFPVIIGIINILFVGAGFLAGRKLGDRLPSYFNIIAGFIIIALGLLNFFR